MSTIAELEAQLAALRAVPAPAQPLKLDLGCGNTTRRAISGKTSETGWVGVDLPGTQGADVHMDLSKDRWGWPDSSVDEVNAAHMVEHIPRLQRVHFFNELHRVLKPGAKAAIITPHWASCRAYGDITHEWPPVSEMFWQYLNKEWREMNAPHVGFTCHFEVGYGYLTAAWLQAEVANRNPEFVQQRTNEALTKYKEAAQDMHATLKAIK